MTKTNEGPLPQPTPSVHPPPRNGRATSAQLKADINSGETGDKVAVFDPGLATLGTDDEAAGTPPSHAAIGQARRDERFDRRASDGRDGLRNDRKVWWIPIAVGVALLCVFALASLLIAG